MKCYLDGISLRANDAQIDLVRSVDSGLLAQCIAIFVPTNDAANTHGVTLPPDEYFYACLEVYKRELEENRDLIAPAMCVQDILDNADTGRLSSILTLEDGVFVDGKLDRLDELYALGVRLISLTWNYENCFGFPQSEDPDAMKLGLKPFGIEAVRHMNSLGIAVDVSHLSDGGFDDVARHSQKPFAASHSCCRTLSDMGRNLTDSQLRTLGEKGGVCGINFVPRFNEKGSEYTKTESVIRHIRHVADVAGVDAAAFGSDFDGFTGEIEFGDCSGMPGVIDELCKVFRESEVEKICKGNALRFLSDVLKG